MGRKHGEDGSREAGGRGASWVDEHLGPDWVEVEPGIYEFLLNEVRGQTGLRLTVPRNQQANGDAPGGGPA